jgi:hypothetical protein
VSTGRLPAKPSPLISVNAHLARLRERGGEAKEVRPVKNEKGDTAGDRRQGERRKGGGAPPEEERRNTDRRAPGKESGAGA